MPVRMDQVQLHQLTGRQTRSAQARWFKNHFDVDVPCDQAGPIMTEQTYQALLERKCGLLAGKAEATQKGRRPEVRKVR